MKAPLRHAYRAMLMASATAAIALPAFAQEQEIFALEEIVVTAQRRAENIQDVPISLTAVGGEKLSVISSSGQDIRFLSARVPSLIVESSFGRTFPRFYIRGLGNTDFDFNASQPVSLVYDDVVLENPILKGFPVFDLDRVEVLRGPQGTLFGRNTPAGIVKFDSVKPKFETDGFVRASYGRFNNVNVEAAVGGGLVDDKVAVRLSALYQRRDDFVDNVHPVTPEKNALEGYDEFAGRAQILVRPVDRLEVLLTGQVRTLDGTATLFRANVFERGETGLIDGFDRQRIAIDGQNNQEVDTYNLSARINYDFDTFSLISVTGYWDGDAASLGDIDGGFGANFLPPDLFGPGDIPFTAETEDAIPNLSQYSQEVRIVSNTDGPLSYQAGFFYFKEHLRIESRNFSTLGDPLNEPGGINIFVGQRQRSEAIGIYGSATYDLTDQLSITAGLRYNDDDRNYFVERTRDTQFPEFLQNPLGSVTRSVGDDNLTWDVSVNYAATDDVNLYARIAKGFRAPSIQGRILFPPATATPLEDGVTTADSETILSYEAGVKSNLLDDRARLNFNVYYYDLDDAQLTAVGGGVNTNRLVNANSVKGYGFEADAEILPIPDLLLTAGLSFNHTNIDDPNLTTAACGGTRVDTFPNVSLCTPLDPIVTPAAPFSPAIVSIDGNDLPQAPRWIFNVTARYSVPLENGELFFYTDWAYRSRINFFLYESVEFQDKKLIEGGLRVGYLDAADRYEVAVFGRNITNDTSAVGGIDFNNLVGYVNEPAVWGIEAGFRF